MGHSKREGINPSSFRGETGKTVGHTPGAVRAHVVSASLGEGHWITVDGAHVFINEKGVATNTKPTLNDLTIEQVDKIDARARTLKTLPTITSKAGEAITVSIHTNPFHGVMDKSELQKPYAVKTHVNGVVNDHVQFHHLDKAESYASRWHRTLAKSER